MNPIDPYKDFTGRLKLLASKHPDLITTTLSNIFTMRLIGNKAHVSSESGHSEALEKVKEDISRIKKVSGI